MILGNVSVSESIRIPALSSRALGMLCEVFLGNPLGVVDDASIRLRRQLRKSTKPVLLVVQEVEVAIVVSEASHDDSRVWNS